MVDLTGRNRLISFRPQKRSSLELLYPSASLIWKRLLTDEKSFRLVPGIVPEKRGDEDSEPVEWDEDVCETAASRGQLAVKLPAKKFESSAQYIRRQAVEMVDETGTNHLFLAVGFLKWFERQDSKAERLSPLLLIPVTLSQTRGGDEESLRFEIAHDGNELSENLSIKLRLEEDFGISLPPLEDESDPEDYLRRIERLIVKRPGWEVVRSAHLAFFSFAKLRMYQDLDPKSWPDGSSILDSPLIRDILDGSERGAEAPAYGVVEVHDGHKTAHKIPLVCEADSSQHTAILKVVEGRNTVIEGPPGTGKSQTITNIVAAALAQGKTVLFLSEKKAALDVVHANLQHCGLGDFCLELHASKSKKQQVHDSIRKRVAASFLTPPRYGQVKREWQDAKAGLCEYVKAVGADGGPWEEPLYASFGRAVSLRAQGIPSYRTKHKGKMPDGDLLMRRSRLLQSFASHLDNLEDFRDHPWKGFLPTEAGAGDEEEICNLFARFFTHIRRLREIECAFGERVGLEECLPHSIVAKATYNFPDHLKDGTESVSGPALPAFREPGTALVMRNVLGTRDAFKTERASAVAVLTEAAALDSALVESLENATSALAGYGLAESSLADLLKKVPSICEAADVFAQFVRIAKRLDEFGLGKARSLGDLQRLSPILTVASGAPPTAGKLVCQALFYPSAADSLTAAKAIGDSLIKKEKSLGIIFILADAAPSQEIDEQRKVLRATGGSFFSFLNGEYRKTRQAVRGYLHVRKSFKMPGILDELEQLQYWQCAVADFKTSSVHSAALGAGFEGTATNWDALSAVLAWCQSLAAEALPFSVAEKTAPEQAQLELRQLAADLAQNLGRLSRVQTDGGDILLAALELDSPQAADLEKAPAFLAKWSVWFRESLSQMKELVRDPLVKVSVIGTATEAGRTALNHASAIENDKEFQAAFGELARGLNSDWPAIEATLEWTNQVENLKLPSGLRDWLFAPEFRSRCEDFLSNLRLAVTERQKIEDLLGDIQNYGALDRDWLFGAPEVSWSEMVSRCERLMSARRMVPQWVVFQKLRAEAEIHELMLFVQKAIDGEFPVHKIADVYALTMVERHGFAAMRQSPNLSTFNCQSFESSRNQFARSDKKLLELNRKVVAVKASEPKVPNGIGRGSVTTWTDGSLLQREMQKASRHIPIRQLMLRATSAIRALKPCMMMSPLSVAQYLDPSLPKFNLVVMDEASQIRPEDALGAIARGEQLVVVGDTKQMPPSNLWQKQVDDDDDEEEDVTAVQDAESVLECALHSFQPVYRLKWHYRSLHEDLIKFSNFHYYDNELIIFPCARNNDESLGIRFHHIHEGRFQSGTRVNIVEAQAVAEAAVRQLVTRPQETLLVATMNRPQQDLVEEIIVKICESDPVARGVVEEARNRDFEKFLVRNLENVQGDQRDVVFISFTYGKDPESGKQLQRFGPITGKSGRRRLNVLFSRAKMRVEAFSSMTYQDIVGDPGALSGTNDLKNYLRFAQEGVLYEEGVPTGEDPDSDFEISVMNVIRSTGLVPVPQVGVASYRVDIGICRPGEVGQYLLGIECDGATYHSSKWARDRDRIREDVLKSRGWKIYRVWSTDWFRQHEDAKERLLSALHKAAGGLNGFDQSSGDGEGDDTSLPAVTAPVTLSKIAAASGYSIYEIRGLAWKLVHFAGEDSETIPPSIATPILHAAGCRGFSA